MKNFIFSEHQKTGGGSQSQSQGSKIQKSSRHDEDEEEKKEGGGPTGSKYNPEDDELQYPDLSSNENQEKTVSLKNGSKNQKSETSRKQTNEDEEEPVGIDLGGN